MQSARDLLLNPTWNPLLTEHAHLALGNELARRYPADVLPFAGVPEPHPANLAALRDLLTHGEPIYLSADLSPEAFREILTAVPGLTHDGEIPCWQMHFNQPIPPEPETIQPEPETIQPEPQNCHPEAKPKDLLLPIHALTAEDAPAMVHLTDVAFPGLFRPRTYVLGQYFGIHIDGELIAMAGERFAVPGLVEISAVCTHPNHTGRGYAARLIRHLLRYHAARGQRSFLHVAQSNTRAIGLYQHLGFDRTRPIRVHRLHRALFLTAYLQTSDAIAHHS